MRLTRLLPLLQLEQAYFPAKLVVALVNEMKQHFRPVDDLTNLTIRVDGRNLYFLMELPLKGDL